MIPVLHGVWSVAAGDAAGFEPIATVTASGGETSLSFTSIPGTYASLQIRGIGKENYATRNSDLSLVINSDTAAHYAYHYLRGDGSSASAGGSINQTAAAAFSALGGTTYGYFAASVIDIHDYASTTRNKTIRAFSGGDVNTTGGMVALTSSLWMSTATITTIQLGNFDGSTFAAGSTFALYGVKAAA